MTKKHFELVARCVANVENDKARTSLANDLADEFEKINDRFKRDAFLKACNVNQPTLPQCGNEES